MAADVHQLFPAGVSSPVASEAPPLPVEPHIVGAALQAERMRALAEQMLLLLRFVPRDAETFDRLHGDLIGAWSDLHDHYRAYSEVLNCKGQA